MQTAALFTSFEAQKIGRLMETPVSTMALHSRHLIKRRDMFFTSLSFLLANNYLCQSEINFLEFAYRKPNLFVVVAVKLSLTLRYLSA